MAKVLVVAPHPDDETLGCGGVLLKHKENGDQVDWVIFTAMKKESGFSEEQILTRKKQVNRVIEKYNFDKVYDLGFPAAELDHFTFKELVSSFSLVANESKPATIYVPNPSDVHTDHGIVFKVVESCCKSFRYPYIKKVRIYETLSETGFDLNPNPLGFKPNLWVDVSEYMETKIDIMKTYASEMGEHPFPRSEESIRSLALLRGAQSGCQYAEAFMSVKEVL